MRNANVRLVGRHVGFASFIAVPSLFVIQGRDQGTRYELRDPHITVGRVPTNDIQLHDTEVSREHARLDWEDDAYWFRDLGSSNGSYVNRKAVNEYRLSSGDQIQIGRTLLLYTGAQQEQHDLSGEVSIVAARGDVDDGSRILHAMRQEEGSEFLQTSADDDSSPWLARARSNLQIMYRTALAVSHTLDIDQLLARPPPWGANRGPHYH